MHNYFRVAFIIFIVNSIFLTPSISANLESIGGQLKENNDNKEVGLNEILDQPGLRSMLYIDLKRTWMVTVTQEEKEDSLPVRKMSFFKGKGKLFVKRYEYETVDSYCTSYTTLDRDRLFSIWAGGSAYRLIIFSAKENEIQPVLVTSWKEEPEFVNLFGDAELEIVVPTDWTPEDGAKTAEIYSWNGKNYFLSKALPWERRFSAEK